MKRILLVEDDPFILDIYSLQFKKEGYKVDIANNCEMAYEKIKVNYPDLVILDIDFGPGRMNGWELLKILRNDEKTKNVKVILLSNHNEGDYPGKIAQLEVKKFFLKVQTSVEEITSYVRDILK